MIESSRRRRRSPSLGSAISSRQGGGRSIALIVSGIEKDDDEDVGSAAKTDTDVEKNVTTTATTTKVSTNERGSGQQITTATGILSSNNSVTYDYAQQNFRTALAAMACLCLLQIAVFVILIERVVSHLQ
jgi:hypothetical protein